MTHTPRGLAAATAVLVAGLSLTACSTNAPASSSGGTGGADGSVDNAKVAFLMPDEASTRYEQHDRPGFVAQMKKVCPTCEVLYNNADATRPSSSSSSTRPSPRAPRSSSSTRSTPAPPPRWSTRRKARGQGHRLRPSDPASPADYYVSFDNETIGKLIAQTLVDS